MAHIELLVTAVILAVIVAGFCWGMWWMFQQGG
jgi:hypothetical protein